MEGTSQATTAQPGAKHATATFDLVAYARKHRYRLRNLHDGGAVPPARYRKPKGERPAAQAGYVGQDERLDALWRETRETIAFGETRVQTDEKL